VAAHIWDYRSRRALPSFGLQEGDIYDARNGLPLCSEIEKAFDKSRVCLCYDPLRRAIRFIVLDPALFNQLALPSALTFSDLDGCDLTFPNSNRPFLCLITYLAADAVEYARKKKWTEVYAEHRNFVDLSISSVF